MRCKKKHILQPQAATSPVFICFADYAVARKKTFGFEWSCASRSEVKPSVFALTGYAVTSAASLFFCPEFGQKNGVAVYFQTIDLLCRQLKSTLQRMNLLHKSRLTTFPLKKVIVISLCVGRWNNCGKMTLILHQKEKNQYTVFCSIAGIYLQPDISCFWQ